ncbi:MAG: hypothetical protein HY248_02080, partial [Fimbriimonas ginsengisoli]|nr:hypothetical protein [Fimbriimonas ginsengisoli]
VLLRWWLAQNPKGRHLWPGNFASQISTPADWPVSEIIDQIDMTRRHPGAGGNVLFSMKPLMADAKGIDAALLAGPYKQTALVPPSPWLGDKPPVQPTLVTVTTPDELRVRIDMKPANLKPVRLWAIWTRYAQEWSLEALPVDEKGLARPMASGGKPLNEVAVAAVDRNGALSAYALWKPDVRTSE